jgi:catechol 2,3-dioxygenase-like lactoylglutathione lyase family enzyme
MIRGGLVTLFVADVESAVRFYVETLGMKLVETADSAVAVIDAGDGFRVALHAGGAATATAGTPEVGFYPKIPIREAIAILENRGVTFNVVEGVLVTTARFTDPDGNVLSLRQNRQTS